MLNYLVMNISGVLSPNMRELVFEIATMYRKDINNPEFRQWVRECCRNFSIGTSKSAIINEQICDQLGSNIDPFQLQLQLSEIIKFNREVIAILEKTQHRLELVLICDIPRGWIEPKLEGLSKEYLLEIKETFFIEEAEFETGLTPTMALLEERMSIPLDQILLVDFRNQITTEALRKGVSSILYVNPFRLQQELGLRNLL